MHAHDPSFEASLLFQAAVPGALALLADDFETIADAHDVPAMRVATDDRSVVLFDCGSIQVMLVGCDQPMEVAHFLDARRPGGAALSETEILARLSGHQYSITILVSDTPGEVADPCDARDELKRALCWQLAETLPDYCAPSLVFWAENDTLYGQEEFAHADVFSDGDAPLPAHSLLPSPGMVSAAEARSADQRAIEARALTYIHTQIVQGAHRPVEKPNAFVTMLHDRLQRSAPLALVAYEAARENSVQVMRGTTMACSTAATGICLLPLFMNGIA